MRLPSPVSSLSSFVTNSSTDEWEVHHSLTHWFVIASTSFHKIPFDYSLHVLVCINSPTCCTCSLSSNILLLGLSSTVQKTSSMTIWFPYGSHSRSSNLLSHITFSSLCGWYLFSDQNSYQVLHISQHSRKSMERLWKNYGWQICNLVAEISA